MTEEAFDRCGGERWTAAMLRGDFEAAWLESDALRERGALDPHRFWDGKDLRGKRVIVRCLHGLGDAVQMLRYAPMLNRRASHVVWEVPPRMVDLAWCFDGVHEVVTWGAGAPAVPPIWESQIEVMELPYLFRTVAGDLPIAERYCHVPSEKVQRAKELVGIRPSVGLVWSSGDWNRDRAVPFETLRPLLEMKDFWNLQGGKSREEGVGLRDPEAICGNGLVALAASIAALDLVITVDTLAAHLAGALGTPAWVMLQKDADWRWQASGDRSAWYPSVRLFRQRQQGNWADVVQQICEEMR